MLNITIFLMMLIATILMGILQYENGYEQCFMDIEKQRRYDSLEALYKAKIKDGLIYIGIWDTDKLDSNAIEARRIFDELMELK